jgi:colanic acid biosynthesis glycosyl transferase WcaI
VKLLFINQWFDPEPCMKGHAFTEALIDEGLDVTVITGTPNYPTGKVYDGYKVEWHRRERQGRTDVHIVPVYPSHDGSSIRRLLNYATFGVSSLIRALMIGRRHDVLYAYHPPMTAALSAVIAAKLLRKPVVVEVQDVWPDSLAATGMADHPAIMSIVGAMARFVYRNSSAIVAQSEGFKRVIAERGGQLETITVIYNWTSHSFEQSTVAKSLGNDDLFHVLYAGNLGPAQDLDTLLDAAQLLAVSLPTARIHLMGAGQSEAGLKARVLESAIPNVVFHPLQPRNEVDGYLRAADALIVILKPDPLFDITIPSKTQSSLAIGRPIIMAVKGEAAGLVVEAGAGECAEPGNAKSIADAVESIASRSKSDREAMGLAGRRYYEEYLSLEIGIERTTKVLRQVISAQRNAQG